MVGTPPVRVEPSNEAAVILKSERRENALTASSSGIVLPNLCLFFISEHFSDAYNEPSEELESNPDRGRVQRRESPASTSDPKAMPFFPKKTGRRKTVRDRVSLFPSL